MTEVKKRIQYTRFGACGDCPQGKEYRPQLNLNFFKDVQTIITAALALINRHQIVTHPNGEGKIKGIL